MNLDEVLEEYAARWRAAQPEPVVDWRQVTGRRRARRWMSLAAAAAAVALLVAGVTLTVTQLNRHPGGVPATVTPGTSTPTPAPSGAATPSAAPTSNPAPAPSPSVGVPAKLPTTGMPGMVQVVAVAFPTTRHGVVLIDQCHPCGAKTGTHTTWAAVTNDGGNSWTVRKTAIPALAGESFHPAFANADDGWAQGGYVTHDGGLTWRKATVPTDTHWSFVDSVSVADGTVWALANRCGGGGGVGGDCPPVILTGAASGSTLIAVSGQPPVGYVPVSILALGADSAYISAVAAHGHAGLATHDGGHTWQPLGAACPAGSVAKGRPVADGQRLLWQGCEVFPSKSAPAKPGQRITFLLARSSDGGQRWRTYPNPDAYLDVKPTSGEVAWALGVDGVGRTTDGGMSWHLVWSQRSGTVQAFSAEDAGDAEVVVVGPRPAAGATGGAYLLIYRTHDAGLSWQPSVVALPTGS